MLNLNKILEPVKTIAIGGHVRPDGDCVGSCMAMYQYIQNNYPDKEVDVFLEEIPSTFYRIKGTDEILHEIDESKHYDLFIVLDCGDTGRLEFSVPLFVSAGHTLCIDHHVSNICFAQDNYVVPDASSTSELVYNLIDKDKITKEIAEALYLGIVQEYFSIPVPDHLHFVRRQNFWRLELMRQILLWIHFTKNLMRECRFSDVHWWRAFCSWKENVSSPIFVRKSWISMV